MLLCDTLHLVGFKLYDRLKMEEDKRKESKQRLLGFESKPKQPGFRTESEQISDTSPLIKQLSESPKKKQY
jgi:hypothetical protein